MLCTCGFTESAGIESTHKDGCMKHRAASVEIGILGSRTSPLVLNKSHDESENKGLNFSDSRVCSRRHTIYTGNLLRRVLLVLSCQFI